ncbi:MAG TPA: YbaK/EbsC family protein [Micromonosporaceae bacterium]
MDSPAAARVAAALRELGATGEIRRLSTQVPTAAAAAAQLGCPVGAIANSLIFAADGAPLLVVTSGAHRVDTGRVATQLGAGKVKRADPRFVLEVTGQEVGGVAPVGYPAPVPALVDVWLSGHDVVWAGGGDHHTMFATSFDELLRMTGGTAAEVGD